MAWARTFDIPAMTDACSVALTIGDSSLSSFFAGAAALGILRLRRFLLFDEFSRGMRITFEDSIDFEDSEMEYV